MQEENSRLDHAIIRPVAADDQRLLSLYVPSTVSDANAISDARNVAEEHADQLGDQEMRLRHARDYTIEPVARDALEYHVTFQEDDPDPNSRHIGVYYRLIEQKHLLKKKRLTVRA